MYQVQCEQTEEILAMKVIHHDMVKSEKAQKHLQEELYVIKLIKHKHCIKFVRNFEDDKNVYILMEAYWGGTLEQMLQARGRLEELEV